MNDILHEILSDVDPRSQTYHNARAAQELYAAAVTLALGAGLSLAFVRVAVWSGGSYNKRALYLKMRLSWDGSRWAMERGLAPIHSPCDIPWGESWLEVEGSRPWSLKEVRKMPGRDCYKVKVRGWLGFRFERVPNTTITNRINNIYIDHQQTPINAFWWCAGCHQQFSHDVEKLHIGISNAIAQTNPVCTTCKRGDK